MGGGRSGRRCPPDTDSSVAPSLGSSPHPHFPPALAQSSILCRPSVLTPGVVPLLLLRVISFPHLPTRELSLLAPGSEGLLCLAGVSPGVHWGQSSEKGFRVPERRPPPASHPQRACRRVSVPSQPSPPTMTEMSEKENEPDDAATHTPPGTVSALQETKVTRGARGLDPCPVRPRPGRPPNAVSTVGSGALGSQ